MPRKSIVAFMIFLLPAVAEASPISISETSDFENVGFSSTTTIGTLGNGINTVSGSISGRCVAGSSIWYECTDYIPNNDFGDTFAIIVPSGAKITSITATLSDSIVSSGMAPAFWNQARSGSFSEPSGKFSDLFLGRNEGPDGYNGRRIEFNSTTENLLDYRFRGGLAPLEPILFPRGGLIGLGFQMSQSLYPEKYSTDWSYSIEVAAIPTPASLPLLLTVVVGAAFFLRQSKKRLHS